MAQDLLVKQNDQGCFDLVVGEQDLETVDGLETTVAVLLFTDARAAPSEVSDPSRRRGWIGNILRDTELGGMIWLASQVRNTQEIRNKIANWAENSLQPLIDDQVASEIDVSTTKIDARGMQLNIEINVKEGETKKFDYWLLTDLGNLTDAD